MAGVSGVVAQAMRCAGCPNRRSLGVSGVFSRGKEATVIIHCAMNIVPISTTHNTSQHAACYHTRYTVADDVKWLTMRVGLAPPTDSSCDGTPKPIEISRLRVEPPSPPSFAAAIGLS